MEKPTIDFNAIAAGLLPGGSDSEIVCMAESLLYVLAKTQADNAVVIDAHVVRVTDSRCKGAVVRLQEDRAIIKMRSQDGLGFEYPSVPKEELLSTRLLLADAQEHRNVYPAVTDAIMNLFFGNISPVVLKNIVREVTEELQEA